ncbi:MAG TPA: DUF6186 family protein [Frankiaceae bacterium]|jgi:hypothetical protein|nr:DUF6186 family protein [Frankiaceae bacterium]
MSSFAVGITGYCLLLALLIGLTLAARRPGVPIASGSRLIASVRRTRTGRILLALGWAWVGWHLFVR